MSNNTLKNITLQDASDKTLDKLADSIIEAQGVEEVKSLIDDFRTMTLKKEMLRLITLTQYSSLADMAIGARLEQHPERLKSSELVEFSKLIQSSIDRVTNEMTMFEKTADIAKGALGGNITVVQNNQYTLDTVAAREKVRIAAEGILQLIMKEHDPANSVDTDSVNQK